MIWMRSRMKQMDQKMRREMALAAPFCSSLSMMQIWTEQVMMKAMSMRAQFCLPFIQQEERAYEKMRSKSQKKMSSMSSITLRQMDLVLTMTRLVAILHSLYTRMKNSTPNPILSINSIETSAIRYGYISTPIFCLYLFLQLFVIVIHNTNIMQGLSLLIDCHKIISWLEDRKKLRADWYDYVKAAEQKIKLLIKDVDQYKEEPELVEFIREQQESFHYCDVNKFVEMLLKTKWAEKRGLIYGYSDARVKEWCKLKKYMDADGRVIGVLNTAKFISQTLTFDLPSLNKSIQLIDTQLTSLKRKIDFNQNTIFQQKAQMQKQKDTLSIDLVSSIEDTVPPLIKSGKDLLGNYQQFLQSNNIQSYLDIYTSITGSTLKMISYLLINGDQYLEVYQNPSSKPKFDNIQKYQEFTEWKPHNQWEIQMEGASTGVIPQVDTITILENRSTRQLILFELNELLFFFKGIKYEMGNGNAGSEGMLVEGDVSKGIREVQLAIHYLTNKKFITVLELKSNKKFYIAFINQFVNYERNIAAMRSQIQLYQRQIEDLELTRRGLVGKLLGLKTKAVQSKNCCEKWLTELIKKNIKITGQINKFQ